MATLAFDHFSQPFFINCRKKRKKNVQMQNKKSLNKLQFLSDDAIWFGWMIKWNGVPLNFG
jgi:hypothetical protein